MNSLSPRALAEKVQNMSIEYASLSAEKVVLTANYATAWLTARKDTKTDKECDRVMAASNLGQRIEVVNAKIKGMDKEMSADKSMLRVLENEARNLY